ncbi:MAG: hypothetical protein ACPLX7_06935 [Candidatus Kapaibacteriota bacterium]
MFKWISFVSMIFFIILSNAWCNWFTISPPERKEKIYSIDIPNRSVEIKLQDYETTFDTISAVGWSSTGGSLFLTMDGGKTWNYWTIASMLPFSVKFLDNRQVVLCGYNFLFDDAEVKIFDLSGNQISNFEFDGNNLPYSKNFFDCQITSSNVFFAGYGGSIFKYSLEENVWSSIFVDSNIVFLKLKAFNLSSSQGIFPLGFLLGGRSFQIPTRLYYSNPDFSQWNLLYDFQKEFPGIELSDFWFNSWNFDNNFPEGFVVGTIDDSVVIFRTNASERKFEIAFLQQNIEQPVGIYGLNDGKNLLVVFSNGEILSSSDKGYNWSFENIYYVGKSFTGVNFYNHKSNDLLPEIEWEKFDAIAYGLDGTIAKYTKDFSLGILSGKLPSMQDYNEVEIYDILGRLVFKEKTDDFKFENIKRKLPKGIFFIIKKCNGTYLNAETYRAY